MFAHGFAGIVIGCLILVFIHWVNMKCIERRDNKAAIVAMKEQLSREKPSLKLVK